MTLPPVSHLSTRGQYAIATARASIYDGGVADLIDLYFDQGFWRRAHIAPEWLRRGSLTGRWCVTLYFRTDDDGRLKHLPYVVSLRNIEADDPVFLWEAVGRLTRMDVLAQQATFRIRPERPGVKPFLLRANVPLQLIGTRQEGESFRVGGSLHQERLVIDTAMSPEGLK